MKAGAPYARLGSIPAKEDPQLTAALALLDQRSGDKFAAIDAIDGDVVGTWKTYQNGFSGSKLGNGRIRAQYRLVGGVNAQYRIYLEVGSTTVISPLGFKVIPPPLFEFDTDKLLYPTGQNYGLVPAPYAGWIGSVFKGGMAAGLIVRTGDALIVGQASGTLGTGDQITTEVEFPIRKARQ